MKVLVADDDIVARQVVVNLLGAWGYTVKECGDGHGAWDVLKHEPELALAILDWEMPGLTGIEVCRRAREEMPARPLHLIILTGVHVDLDALVQGFAAGADDFLTKPFEPRELKARLQVGERLVQFQRVLAQRVRDLEASLAGMEQLQRLLPICAICKRVRDDGDYWQEVETYLTEHARTLISHSLCPACARTHFPEQAAEVLPKPAAAGPAQG
jgi:CheY-like chemotaxis protein